MLILEISGQIEGRLRANRAKPVSREENQTAWVSVPGIVCCLVSTCLNGVRNDWGICLLWISGSSVAYANDALELLTKFARRAMEAP